MSLTRRIKFIKTVRLLLAAVVGTLCASAEAHYGRNWDKEHSGAQVWRVELGASGQLAALQRIEEDLNVLHRSHSSAVVYVRADNLDDADTLIRTLGLKSKVMVEDFSQYLKEIHLEEQRTRAFAPRFFWFLEWCTPGFCSRPFLLSYMTFNQMEWFLKSLATQYPANVKLSEQRQSTEGRSLWLVSVTQAGGAPTNKVVFVEGGAHAREWVSPATVLNILMAQVESCVARSNCDATFYFMPIINPDGYIHSWTTDRLWRKNRSLPPDSSTSYGTDINRNFGFQWGVSGASSSPSSETYKGPSPFSTPEASAVRDALQAITSDTSKNLVLYITYHSYGQQILYPWSYTASVVPPSRTQDIKAAEAYSNALKAVNKKTYEVLQSAAVYPAAGTSDDYAKSIGAKHAYTVELRDANTFVLSTTQIKPTYLENWAGFKAMVAYVLGTTTTA